MQPGEGSKGDLGARSNPAGHLQDGWGGRKESRTGCGDGMGGGLLGAEMPPGRQSLW